jgi:hypothetical protein
MYFSSFVHSDRASVLTAVAGARLDLQPLC